MNNTLTSLNNALFEEIERLQSDDLDAEQFELEAKRATVVSNIADKIIRNGELALKTMEHLNEYGYGSGNRDKLLAPVPAMLDEQAVTK